MKAYCLRHKETKSLWSTHNRRSMFDTTDDLKKTFLREENPRNRFLKWGWTPVLPKNFDDYEVVELHE